MAKEKDSARQAEKTSRRNSMLHAITDDQQLRTKHLEVAAERNMAIQRIANTAEMYMYAQLIAQFQDRAPLLLQQINQLRAANAPAVLPPPPALAALAVLGNDAPAAAEQQQS